MTKKNLKDAYLKGEWLSTNDFFKVHKAKDKNNPQQLSKLKIYLFPLPLVSENINHIPPIVSEILPLVKLFFVENIRAARRYISSLKLEINIQELEFYELNINTKQNVINNYCKLLISKNKVGIMSENGLPGIADPGANLIFQAQQMNAKIVPLTGPSSIFLALMSSGLNGQNFHFNGYLPIKSQDRISEINKFSSICKRTKATQIFIETPYRNQALYNDLIATLSKNIYLSIAQNITGKNEKIETMSVGEWKKRKIIINKIPCIFLFNYI